MSAPQIVASAIEWEAGLTNAWNTVANFVPKLLVFLLVLLIGWLIAKAVSKVVGVLLDKVGFDRLLDRAGARDFAARSGVKPISLITKIVYYFILLIALQLALTAFGSQNPVSQIVNDIVAWLPKLLVAIIIVVIAAAVANAVKDILMGVLGGLSYGPMLAKIVAGFIIALGVIAALNQVGIGTTVTLPVLIAVLATVGGILVVGVGGGLVMPMRNRWEGWLDGMSNETQKVRASRSTTTSGYESGYTDTTATRQTDVRGSTYAEGQTGGTYTQGQTGGAYAAEHRAGDHTQNPPRSSEY